MHTNVKVSHISKKTPKRCSCGCGKRAILEGLATSCWKKANPGKEWPWKRRGVPPRVVVLPAVLPTIKLTPGFTDMAVMINAIDAIDHFISKSNLPNVHSEDKADLIFILYDFGVKAKMK